jgi:hypothetical protein
MPNCLQGRDESFVESGRQIQILILQIRKKIGDLLFRHRVQKPFRHDGNSGMLAFDDIGFRDPGKITGKIGQSENPGFHS